MKRLISLFVFLFCLLNFNFSQSAADKILGVYSVIELDSKEESRVRIYKTANGKYEGQVIWLKNPNFANGKPKLDIKNPNPALRNTRGDKIILMKNFTYNSKKNEWEGGTIYDPVHGKIYDCYLKFESDKKLKVRGFIGVAVIGKSMYWNKIE